MSSDDHSKASSQAELTPLVIVEGFLGGAGAILWAGIQEYLNDGRGDNYTPRRVIFPSIGPVSSLHDRACELYYALRGGTVDYGEDHSRVHGHSRYGRSHSTGLYPLWSQQYPLHFFGHSVGGPTVTKLQFLLESSHFSLDDHPDMILSINAVNSPFRGTQLVYILGEHTTDVPSVRRFSIGSLIAFWINLIAFFSPVVPRILDLHTESRSMSYRERSITTLLRQLWRSDWAESKDATPFDMTFIAADEREANLEGYTNAGTYYRSYVSRINTNAPTCCLTAPVFSLLFLPFYLASRLMYAFNFTLLRPTPSFLKTSSTSLIQHYPRKRRVQVGEISDELRHNDGITPLFSQWHPLPCSLTKCNHHRRDPILGNLERGVWHVCEVEESHHLSLLPAWRETLQQRTFWQNLGIWLWHIDDKGIGLVSKP